MSCTECPAETGDGNIPRILAAWNRRAPDVDADRDQLLKLGQAVVNLVEGLDGFGLARSAIDGERLKDETAWVEFYNGIKAAARATAPDAPTEGDER